MAFQRALVRKEILTEEASEQREEGEEQGRDNNLAEDVNLAFVPQTRKKRGADE
jgi:hypothetical protein